MQINVNKLFTINKWYLFYNLTFTPYFDDILNVVILKNKFNEGISIMVLQCKFQDKGKTTLAGLLSGSNLTCDESGINRFNFTLSGSVVPRPGIARVSFTITTSYNNWIIINIVNDFDYMCKTNHYTIILYLKNEN